MNDVVFFIKLGERGLNSRYSLMIQLLKEVFQMKRMFQVMETVQTEGIRQS